MTERISPHEQSGELSESDRELVRRIEQLPFDEFEREELILVWRGLKRATELDIVLREWKGDEPPPPRNESEIVARMNVVRDILRELNLTSVIGEDEILQATLTAEDRAEGVTAPARESRTIFIGRTAEDAARLAELDKELDADTAMYWDVWEGHQRALGELYGFPKTAVEAYIAEFRGTATDAERGENVSQLTRDLPHEIRRQDFTAFATYRTSKTHWQEELETAKRWAEEVKNVSPTLYEEIVRAYREHPW